MALIFADRVLETTISVGTGSYSLSGTTVGFQSFESGIGVGNHFRYCVTNDIDWEVGTGFMDTGTIVNRTEILASSNNDLAVDWTVGVKRIFAVNPASDVQTVVDFAHEHEKTVAFLENQNRSIGLMTKPVITDNGVSTISLTACRVFINSEDEFGENVQGEILTVSPADIELVTNAKIYYVVIEHNGSLGYALKDQYENKPNSVLVAIAIRTGTAFHITEIETSASGLPEKTNALIIERDGFQKLSGLELSANNLDVTVSSGVATYGVSRSNLDEISAGVDGILFYSWNGTSYQFSQKTEANNTQYNGPTGLVNLLGDTFNVNWFWRGVETQDHLYSVLDREVHTTLASAFYAKPPAPPEYIAAHAVFIGGVIYQNGDPEPKGIITELLEGDLDAFVGSALDITGIVRGCQLTLNANVTKIDISPGLYYIQGVRYSYPGIVGLDHDIAAGNSARRYGLDSTGLISQQPNFTDEQLKTILPIGRIQTIQGQTGTGSDLIPPIDLRYLIGQQGYYDRLWRENVFGALYAQLGGSFSENSTPLRIDQVAGVMFDAQGKRIEIPESLAIEAKYLYHVSGTWTVQPQAELVINTTQYDNGTDLTTMTDNYWVSHTLLKGMKAEDQFFLVVGNSEHTTQTQAEAEPLNFGPFVSEAVSGLIGVAKIIVRKNSTLINRLVNTVPRIKGTDQQTTGISALLPTVSNPESLKNYEDAWRYFQSGSIAGGCDLTDNGNGTFNISVGDVAIRTNDEADAPLVVYRIQAAGPFTPDDNTVTHYFIDYNNGSPTWSSGDSIFSYNGTDKMQAYSIGRRDTRLWVVDARGQAIDGNRKIRRRDIEWSGGISQGFWHSRDGTGAGATERNPTLTAGRFFYGLQPVSHSAFDCSIAGTGNLNVFDYYYNRSNYTLIADQKQINNTQYDNAGTLTSMNPNRFRTDWMYLVLDTYGNPRIIIVMGTNQFGSLAEAQNSSVPATIPGFISGVSVLVGRYIIRTDATTVNVSSTLGSQFTSSPVSEHNSLGSLQGGTLGEYYHLTENQATRLTSTIVNGGAIDLPITTVVSDTTLSNVHHTVLVNSATNPCTITLPVASTVTGRIYNIKKIDTQPQTIIYSNDLIDGEEEIIITSQFTTVTVQSNGSSWFIL